jgi:ribulose-phosphate 3-epimerase
MATRNPILLAPSILAANFAKLGDQISVVEKAGADLIHLDIMDGHFVPNISFGPAIVKTVHGLTQLPLDTHLMIENPDFFLDDFQKAGTTYLTVHAEACSLLDRTVAAIRQRGMKPGVSLKPETPLSALEAILAHIDLVLLMSVNPGFGGQKFIPETLAKIRSLNEMISSRKLNTLIEVDGGVDESNVADLVKAGVRVLVAGSAIFGAKDISKAMGAFRANIALAQN